MNRIEKLSCYYPKLRKGISLHLTPTYGIIKMDKSEKSSSIQRNYRHSLQNRLEFINDTALKLFNLCDGNLTIDEIIEKIFGKDRSQEINSSILYFFNESIKKGHIKLHKKKLKLILQQKLEVSIFIFLSIFRLNLLQNVT